MTPSMPTNASELLRLIPMQARERLLELRKLVKPYLDDHADRIKTSLQSSPIIKTDKCTEDPGGSLRGGYVGKFITMKCLVSTFRDMLDEDTMLALIIGYITADDIMRAIEWPVEYSAQTDSARSTTGYIIGRPKSFGRWFNQ